MRADRLLSMLMLLQARGKMTAQELAAELEVSVRTIYRDVTALCSAGVPVTADRGPGGGVALIETYRTNLTGFTDGEVRALLLLTVPAALTDLGIDTELRQALRKLSAAVPATQREGQQRVQQRVHLDATPWHHEAESSMSLQLLQRALLEDRCLTVRYELAWSALRTRLVLPLGLVAKSDNWYLVCTWGEGPRVIEVADLVAARLCDCPEANPLARPQDFDLAAFWSRWCEGGEQTRPLFEATLMVTSELQATFRHLRGNIGIETLSPAQDDGWQRVLLRVESFESARTRILGWGGAVRVLKPEGLRESVEDFARQIMSTYAV